MRMTQRHGLRTPHTRGFSLAELVVTVGILVISLSGILVAFVGAIALNEDSEMTSRALDAAMTEVEKIRMQAITNFNGVTLYTASAPFTFDIPGPPSAPNAYAGISAGALTISQPVGALFYVIEAKVCWQGRGGRSMGEDQNLNGILDLTPTSEDRNLDGQLTCPVDLVTTVAQRN